MKAFHCRFSILGYLKASYVFFSLCCFFQTISDLTEHLGELERDANVARKELEALRVEHGKCMSSDAAAALQEKVNMCGDSIANASSYFDSIFFLIHNSFR